ncbi:MAG: hypothetical protein QNJ36_07425, partial [Calothrix sp. MO_167.B42]|nr:hypothetical protein [Calothrix sp. MO_167.B42]
NQVLYLFSPSLTLRSLRLKPFGHGFANAVNFFTHQSCLARVLVVCPISFDGYFPVVFRRLWLLDWGFQPQAGVI